MRPGTKVFGRPSSPIAIATSRVSAVSEISASVGISSVWLSPSFAAQSGRSALHAREQAVAAFELDGVALAVVETQRFDAREAVSAQARQVVESCPPENSTSAVSDEVASLMARP